MRNLLISTTLLFTFSGSVFAQSEEFRGAGFNAPTVSGTESVLDPVKGEIIFDGSPGSEAFYGYIGSNTWHNFSAATVPAGPTTSGIVTHGADSTTQTFGGNKIFNGSITPAGGIVGKNDGVPIEEGYVGQKITWETPPSTQSFGTSTSDWANASITLTPGVWLVIANIGARVSTAAATGATSQINVSITDGLDNIVQEQAKALYVYSPSAAAADIISCLSFSFVANIPSSSPSTTYKIRANKSESGGTASASIYRNGANINSEFFAVRII
ncbi:hypothetical protein [Oligoflexus tunisiensis]|uniref:hypothetical protein n=1 Tax=Oligoflexus tunisiensis TaxID=708132 RepID=UPI00114D2ABA|nr:hypothetical protein [Oligoflexus tunisiensis]